MLVFENMYTAFYTDSNIKEYCIYSLIYILRKSTILTLVQIISLCCISRYILLYTLKYKTSNRFWCFKWAAYPLAVSLFNCYRVFQKESSASVCQHCAKLEKHTADEHSKKIKKWNKIKMLPSTIMIMIMIMM